MPQRVVISNYDEHGNDVAAQVTSSAKSAVAITPSDVTTIAPTKGLYVGVTGDVVVTMSDGNDVTFKTLSGGLFHALSVIKVKSTGTTATNIVAVY